MMVQVARCTIDSIRATVFSFSALVIPATGSSRRRSVGSWRSSMAISSHCFWPWERVPARSRACWSSPTCSSTRAMPSSSDDAARAARVARNRFRPEESTMFSKTV
ncbi:MAG: hypothetical protein A3I03_14100 [Candidatus Rokubacteria bacterium RIFCSPLOWO2_02_FULL_68_19]|nr:MAG: hypothetical protein A3I03_14100 [Candidatus Rokubacteria bacterium RIFCSPLOWO2_02_FULL_68_19]